MKFLVVVNPISGGKSKDDLISKVQNTLRQGDSIEIYTTTGNDDKSKIKELISQTNPDRILIAGGDGTIKTVAELLNGEHYPLGILPAGSANGLASDLNLPDNEDDFIPVALYGKTKKIDCICIHNELSLHISDFGMNAELIKEFEESSIRGKIGYALNSIQALLKHEGPYTFTIETEQEKFTTTANMLAFANSKKYGTGAVVNPNGELNDGIFELLIFKKLDIKEIAKTLINHENLSDEFLEIIPVTKVKVVTENPVSFQIDGEFCDHLTSIEAYILPDHLEIAVN